MPPIRRDAAKARPIMVPDDDFIGINIMSLRLDSVPRCDLYFQPGPDQPFVLYCQRNTRFTEANRRTLQQNRISRLFIPRDQVAEYQHYLADHLPEILDDKSLGIKEKSEILYTSAIHVVERVLENPARPENIQRSKDFVHNAVDFMGRDDFHLEHLLKAIRGNYYLYTHSVNVVAYSIALGMQAGIRDRASLREMANGALLHDVGMSQIDPSVRDIKGMLSTHQWERVQQHPREAYEQLRKTNTLGEVALDIVLHHHERLDGTGYPDHLKGEQVSKFVRVVMIADIFDALTTERPHQPPMSTYKALTTMQREMKHTIDTDLLRQFIEMMGLRGVR